MLITTLDRSKHAHLVVKQEVNFSNSFRNAITSAKVEQQLTLHRWRESSPIAMEST
ncbi:unnamed protein product [Brassica rapa subsp. narinosa]